MPDCAESILKLLEVVKSYEGNEKLKANISKSFAATGTSPRNVEVNEETNSPKYTWVQYQKDSLTDSTLKLNIVPENALPTAEDVSNMKLEKTNKTAHILLDANEEESYRIQANKGVEIDVEMRDCIDEAHIVSAGIHHFCGTQEENHVEDESDNEEEEREFVDMVEDGIEDGSLHCEESTCAITFNAIDANTATECNLRDKANLAKSDSDEAYMPESDSEETICPPNTIISSNMKISACEGNMDTNLVDSSPKTKRRRLPTRKWKESEQQASIYSEEEEV